MTTVANGGEIETIEGLAASGKIARLQELFSRHHALQCGYCTPGMLITAHDLMNRHQALSPSDIREGMSASLCRCTGYSGIIEAVTVAQAERQASSQAPAAPGSDPP